MNTLPRLFRAWTSGIALAICVIAGASAAPVCVDPGGIGGTGSPAHSGGVGGTGVSARSGGIGGSGAPVIERGIGGTGAPITQLPGGLGGTGSKLTDSGLGGTGIVGTITGFASICVNGVEVHFADDVPVTMNGSPSMPNELAVGQVVAVEAGVSGRGLEAKQISILNAFEGPVTTLPRGSEPMMVMGQAVRVAAGTQLPVELRTGQTVRVSGLRNARGEVIATWVERAPDQLQASAIGALDRNGKLDGLALGATKTLMGGEILVRGNWSGTSLDVEAISHDPSIPFAGRVRQAVVEGLIHEHTDSRMKMSGFSVVFDPASVFDQGSQNTLEKDRRIRVHGVFTGAREITASRIELVRPDLGSNESSRRNGARSDADNDQEGNDEKSRSRIRIDDDGGSDFKAETRTESSRIKIERELTPSGEIARERIESRIESPDGNLERRERIDIRESGGVIETRERIEVFVGGERVQRIERIDRIDSPDKVDRPEAIERPEKVERLEKVERTDRVERIEKAERPDKVERLRRDD